MRSKTSKIQLQGKASREILRVNLFSNLLPLRDERAEAENLFSTSADADKLFEFIECTALCSDALEIVRRAVTS